MDVLRGEVPDKQQLLKEAKSSRIETRRRAILLELVNRTLRADRHNIPSMIKAREAMIGELEKENSELLERISAFEVENAKLLERPSTSHASESPAITRRQYEEWILTEARVEVVRELGQTGFVFETAMEEARVKVRKARLACVYEPATPQPDAEDDDEVGVD